MSNESAAEDEVVAQEAAAQEEAEEPAEEAADPGIGDVIEVGDFRVSVTGVVGGMPQIGDDTFGEKAQGQFVKVMETAENPGDAAEYVLDSDPRLIDDSDRQHPTSSASWMLDEESLFLTEINPGNTVEGVLLYDIPEDAVPTSVDLQGGMFSSAVRVSLNS